MLDSQIALVLFIQDTLEWLVSQPLRHGCVLRMMQMNLEHECSKRVDFQVMYALVAFEGYSILYPL